MAATAGGGMKGQSLWQQKKGGERDVGGRRFLWRHMDGGRALEQQSGGMTAQSVVARNGGYRGWRHERAVTMPTKRRRRGVGGGRQVAATADGCMGQYPALRIYYSSGE